MLMFILVCILTLVFINCIGAIMYVLAHVAIVVGKLAFMLVAFICACVWFVYNDLRKEMI